MHRLSRYTILSRQMADSSYILMNGISGALDVVPATIGDLLESALHPRDENLLEQIIGALNPDVRREWAERGHLTEFDADVEKSMVIKIAGALHDGMVGKPTFMIVPNLDCNYRCTYCFERPMQNKIKSKDSPISHVKDNVVMRDDQVDAIYNSIREIKSDAGLEEGGQIILYGGEPLDKSNRNVVEKIVLDGKARGYMFACITNGHDLDSFMDLLGPGLIDQVQISIDGPREIHDKKRIFVSKESSFDKVTANIDLAREKTEVEIQIRVHVDPSNIDHFDTILAYFNDKGWTNNPKVVIYANTIYNKEEDGTVGVELDHSDIVAIIGEKCRRFDNVYTSAPAIHAARAMEPAFKDGERFALKGTYCTANSGNYIFAADSSIYACWESVGKSCSRIGSYSLKQGIRLSKAITSKWFGRSIEKQTGCQTCRYALVCGGGCAQYAEYNSGDLYGSYCDDFDKTFRAGLADEAGRMLVSEPVSSKTQRPVSQTPNTQTPITQTMEEMV